MLVLSRKVGEEIIIDGDIRVMVLQIRGEKVRLGVEAPQDVPVFRAEILARDADSSGDSQGAPEDSEVH